jgi:signal transduction histidine kinase
MSPRRSLSLPITLAVVMIVLLVLLTVGWVLLLVVNALADSRFAGLYWALLSVGSIFYLVLVVGVVMYLALSVKAINLNRRQSNFVDSVTHELKTPISSLKLYLQTLHRRALSAEQQDDFHRAMLEDVERLDRLINQVLDAGRLDAGLVDGELAVVPLEPLVRECAEMICLRYRVKSETVVVDVVPCSVRARRADLDMILRNLIDNAVKYAAAEPRVRVTGRLEASGTVVVQVSDNGAGIPAKLRRKIFGRFVRLGTELERSRPGTGLGLYIVRTVVRRLRGSITVTDRPDGPGTVFEVRLPGGVSCAGAGEGVESEEVTR